MSDIKNIKKYIIRIDIDYNLALFHLYHRYYKISNRSSFKISYRLCKFLLNKVIKVIEKNILHTANIFVIGLGGKLYPGLHYKQVDKHINKILLEQYEYSLDKSLDIIDSRFKSFSLFERKLTMLDDFVEFFKHTSDKSHDNIFKKYDIPLFYFEIKQNLILNPILSEFNFNRKMSPYLVYATIHDYFLTGTIDSGVVKKKSKKNKRLMLYEI